MAEVRFRRAATIPFPTVRVVGVMGMVLIAILFRHWRAGDLATERAILEWRLGKMTQVVEGAGAAVILTGAISLFEIGCWTVVRLLEIAFGREERIVNHGIQTSRAGSFVRHGGR